MRKEEQEYTPRELRHRRRIRSQIFVYTTTAFVIALMVGGVVFAAIKVSDVIRGHRDAASESESGETQDIQETVSQPESQEEIAISEPEPPIEEETQETTDALDELVNTCIAAMSLEDKVAGLFIITPEQLTGVNTAVKAGDATQTALNEYAIGGLVYQKANIKSEDQFSTMTSTTATMSRYPIFLAVTEEGADGTIAKSAISVPDLKTFEAIASDGDLSAAYSAGQTMGVYLGECGINLNLAPSADLNGKSYSFGTDTQAAAGYVSQVVTGLEEQKVSACLKTFPGLATAVSSIGTGPDGADTDQGMAVIQSSEEELRTMEFPVFQAGIDAGADFCMVSNISAPNVTGDNTPCVLSDRIITELLRGELNFQGIVVTDDFTDAAITEYYTSGEAAVKAIRAGADMIYLPESFKEAYEGVLEAVNTGALTEERIDESLHRIYRVKYADRIE